MAIKSPQIKKTSALIIVLAVLFLCWQPHPSRAQSSYDLSKEKILFTVGYAHLDTQWRWDYQKTIKEYIWNTMVDNFALFEKYPNYVFNFSGANRYRMMKEYYPKEYARVKDYVAEGRWFPSGSSLEENDVMAPSFESIIRQVLYGTQYFKKEFGFSSKEYMLPDCFGFPASLPSLLAHCGLKGFSTQKLTWGSAVGVPFNVGTWYGPDGQFVVAALNPGDYTGKISGDLTQNPTWKLRVNENGQKYGVYGDYMYFGTGDVGGAPDENSVRNLEQSLKSSRQSELKVVSARADEFFLNLNEVQIKRLPTYSGEFLLTNHSAGSITSQAAMKRWNRKNEFLGYSTEAAAVMADWLGGAVYNQEKINEAWRLVLGAQFHDILPGTSIPRAYEFSWNDEILAANLFGSVLKDSAGAVIRAFDTRVNGYPVVVYNPLAFDREDVVEAEVELTEAAEFLKVFAPDGREVPSQVLSRNDRKFRLVFLATVPSLGFSVFEVRPSSEPCRLNTGLRVGPNFLENGRYLVKFNRDGEVSSLFDKKAGRELLASAARLSFHYEKPQQWPAWNMDWEDRMKPPAGYVTGPARITVVENGPARVSLEIEREARGSKFVQTVRLAAGGAGDRLEFYNLIDWATRESSLKAVFPLTVSNPQATYNWGLGTIQRGNNDPKKFEVPSHLWFDLTDKNGSYGVSVLEDCKYGSDKPADNMLRLTLLYTPGVRSWPGEQATQDFGRHEILYALYGHQGDWRQGGSGQQALRLNQPLLAFQTISHEGSLGKSVSFLRVSHDSIHISAVKKAENSDEVIIRLVETRGQSLKKATLSFLTGLSGAREVNGVEEEVGPAVVREGKLVFDLNPYGIKTFAIKLLPAAGRLAPPSAVPVELPYNLDVFSRDENRKDGAFDSSGRSFPAELMPDVITDDSLIFRLGPKEDGAKNAVVCQGQEVELPDGKFNRLYILAAASRDNQKVRFGLGESTAEIPIAYWSGFIGQWDNRTWAEGPAGKIDFDREKYTYTGVVPGYTRQDEVALFSTHLHHPAEGNEPYIYGYVFKYAVDLPAGTRSVKLPVNPEVKILAMTVAWNENDNSRPVQALFDVLERDPADYERWQVVPLPAIKPDRAYVSPSEPASVNINAGLEGAEIHYTLDGSEPTEKSPVYEGPITIKGTAVLKAIAFHPSRQPSPVASAFFSQSYPVKDIVYFSPPAPTRPGAAGEKTLIDLVKARPEARDLNWQGYEGNDLVVVLDLGRKQDLYELELSCFENNNARIFLPVRVEVEVSLDGRKFEKAAEKEYALPEKPQGPGPKSVYVSLRGSEGRFVRIKAVNPGTVPEGFRNAGQKTWLLLDELYIR